MKARFLPAALCPGEGGGGGGGLHGAVDVFAMSLQCMGAAERAEHLQGTESSEREDLVGHVEK